MSNHGNDSRSVTGTGISTTIFDSLPYIDTIHPDHEQYAISLMEQEMKQQKLPSSKLHPRVVQSIESYSSRKRRRLSQEEILDLMNSNKNISTFAGSTNLDTIDDESFPSKPTGSDTDTVEEWIVTIRKARVAYEKERLRQMELELDQDTLSKLWKRFHQQVLDVQLEQYQRLVQHQQYQVSKVNYERQEHQTKEYHPTLSKLQYQYHDLLQKIYALQNAIRAEEL